MLVSTVKHNKNIYNTYTINKRRASREDFGIELANVMDAKVLQEMVVQTVAGKGRVYGIYQNKKLIGLYIFERVENYFEEGKNKVAYRLKEKIHVEDTKNISENIPEKIEKDMQVDLVDQIDFGQISSYLLGGVLGFWFGWMLFDSIPLGICYALLGGIISSLFDSSSSKSNTVDFSNIETEDSK